MEGVGDGHGATRQAVVVGSDDRGCIGASTLHVGGCISSVGIKGLPPRFGGLTRVGRSKAGEEALVNRVRFMSVAEQCFT